MSKNELTVIERAAVALGTAEHEKALVALVAQSATITIIKNTAGRDQCHGALMTLKNARIGIEKAGKEARDDATKFSKAVIAEEKRLVAITQAEESRLQEIRDAWDEAREAEKRAKAEAEANRVAKIRDAIEEIRRMPGGVPTNVSDEIDEHADDLARMPITLEFYAEMSGEAEVVRETAVAQMRELAAKARAREAEEARIVAERAELARMRAEQEERDRVAAAERVEQERIDRERRDAEEAARRAALEKADAIMRAERAEHDKRMAAERAEMQRQQDEAAAEQRRRQKEIDAEQAAARAELQRQQDELAAQRRAEADAAAEKQRKADLAAAKKLREAQEKAEYDRRAREVADTAVRNAASALFDACRQFVHASETSNEDELEAAYQAAKAVIGTVESEIDAETPIPF